MTHSLDSYKYCLLSATVIFSSTKGQLNSECQPKITRISSLPNKQGYDPCLFGRAEIFKFFGWHFGRNDDLINTF